MSFNNRKKEFEAAEERDVYAAETESLITQAPLGFCPKISAECRTDCMAYFHATVVCLRRPNGIGKNDTHTAEIRQARCDYTDMFCSPPIE